MLSKFIFTIVSLNLFLSIAHAAPKKTKSSPKVSQTSNVSKSDLSTIPQVWKKLRGSPFKMNFMNAHLIPNGSTNGKFNSDIMLNDTSLQYNINRQNDVRILTRHRANISERKQADQRWEYIETRYRKNRIFEADKNGFNLSAEMRHIYIPDEIRRNATKNNGWARTQVNFSQPINAGFSYDISLMNLYFDRKTNQRSDLTDADDQRTIYQNRAILSGNFILTDKLTFILQFTYLHDTKMDEEKTRNKSTEFKYYDYVWFDPQINYVLTSWLDMDLDIGWTLFNSHDSKFLTRQYAWNQAPSNDYWLYLGFNFSVF